MDATTAGDGGVWKKVLTAGEALRPEDGSLVKVHCVGRVVEDDSVFFSTYVLVRLYVCQVAHVAPRWAAEMLLKARASADG